MAPGRVDVADARIGWAAYFLLGAVHLAVVWRHGHFASLDGPVHVYIAAVLAAWREPAAEALHRYLELNPGPHPNLTIYALLYGLMQLAAPATAEKLLVSGYVLALPLAVRYAARPLTPAPWFAAFLAWPLALSLPLFLGFYNYCYGLVVVMLGLGLYLRAANMPSTRRHLWLGLAGLAAFFTHVFAALALGAMVAVAALWRAGAAVRGGESLVAAGRRQVLAPAVALLPTAVLLVHFVATSEVPPSPLIDAGGLVYRLLLLLFSGFLWSLGARDQLWGAGLLAIVLLVLYQHLRHPPESAAPGERSLLAVTLAFLLLFLTVPVAAGGGGWLLHRLQPYLYLAFALWLGSRAFGDRFRRVVSVVLVAFTAGLGLWRLPQLDEIERYRAAYLGLFDAVGPGETVMAVLVGPLVDEAGRPAPSWRSPPLHHLMAYPAAARRSPVLGLHQLRAGVFPLRYRAAQDPFAFRVPPPPGGSLALHRLTDLEAYNAGPERRVDWVLVAGAVGASDVHAIGGFMAQLARGYVLAGESARPGPFRLYRLKPGS